MSTSDPLLGLYCRPGFMNPGVVGRYQPARVSLPPDPLDAARPIVARVIKAYQRAMAEHRTAAPSLWDHAARQHQAFLDALTSGNVDVAAAMLAGYFRSALVWGLARQPIEDASPGAFAADAVRTADALVSLARAAGVLPVASIEQGGPLHDQVLPDAVYETLVSDVERATGLDLAICPGLASNGGWQFGARATNVDVLLHSYSVLRLQQLGITSTDSMVEIGGGYGCLAALAAKAGFGRYTVCDLPWVNAMQGYLLIRAFGADAVRLYGEDGPGSICVLPFWSLHDLPRHSVDLAINVNSLPEIGYATAAEYVATIARISRLGLLSINQEAQSATVHGTRQLRVWELVRAAGGLRLEGRHPFWMEQGYVEELYRPA
jgi:hypothetical protein